MTTRPKLQIKRTPLQIVLDGLCFVTVIGTVVLVANAWGKLPDRIPHHFDFSGRPDAWGGKWVLLVLPVFSVVLFIFLGAIRNIPHRFNYLWPITEQNAERQYRIALSMLTVLRLEVVTIFAYVTWGTIRSARDGACTLGAAFLPVVVCVILTTIVAHAVSSSRAR